MMFPFRASEGVRLGKGGQGCREQEAPIRVDRHGRGHLNLIFRNGA
jgi:hypothetical protein